MGSKLSMKMVASRLAPTRLSTPNTKGFVTFVLESRVGAGELFELAGLFGLLTFWLGLGSVTTSLITVLASSRAD